MYQPEHSLKEIIEDRLSRITARAGQVVELIDCPRVNAETIERIIQSFPSVWNFHLQSVAVTIIGSKSKGTWQNVMGVYLYGAHDFGTLTFMVEEVKVVRKPDGRPNVLYVTAV